MKELLRLMNLLPVMMFLLLGTASPSLGEVITLAQGEVGGASINSLGEVVWSQYDGMSGGSRLFSSTRGQLTFEGSRSYPSTNSLGDLVWVEYEYNNDTPWNPGNYVLRGTINGSPVTLATSTQWIGRPDINDRGEVVWTQADASGAMQIHSNLRGRLTNGPLPHGSPSLNNAGDLVFLQPAATGPEQSQVWKLAAGALTPSLVTSEAGLYGSTAINDSGEVVWTRGEPAEPASPWHLFSSMRGELAVAAGSNIFELDLNNCGDVVYTALDGGVRGVYRFGSAAPCATYSAANDSQAEAAPVAFGDIFAGVVDSAGSSVDWYRFDAAAGDRIYVTVNFDNRPPNTLSVGLYDGEGNLLGLPEGANPLRIKATAGYSGAYYLKAEGQGGRFGYAVSLGKYSENCGSGPCRELLTTGTSIGSINSLGEVVWSQYGMSDGSRLFSSTRGQLTFEGSRSYPSVNNLGDLVWVEYDYNDDTPWNPGSYVLRGTINGSPVTLATSPQWIGRPDINDRGEVVWTQADAAGAMQIHSNLRGRLTNGPIPHGSPSLNNAGDLVFLQPAATGLEQSEVYKLQAGSSVPVLVTSEIRPYRSVAINDGGEIVWTVSELVNGTFSGQVVSTLRGVLPIPVAAMLNGADLNNCGDVVYGVFENGVEKLYRFGSAAPCMAPPERTFALVVDKLGSSGNGTVTSFPAGIDLATSDVVGTGAFPAGTVVTLVASPDATSVFGGWAGSCGGTGPCQVTLDQARGVTAVFLNPVSPAVFIAAPLTGAVTGVTPQLLYSVSDGVVAVTVDGVTVAKTSGDYLGPLPQGTHTVRVYATNVFGTGFAEATFTVDPQLSPPPDGPGEDFESGGFTGLPWTFAGDAQWLVTDAKVHGGLHAAKAGAILDGQVSAMQTTVNCAAGNLSFWFSIDSESYFDFLYFYVDGVLMGSWSGNVWWTQVTVPVTPGSHTFKWVYSKDGSVSTGADTAWVDDIVLPIQVLPPAISISSPVGGASYNQDPLLTFTSTEPNPVVTVDGVVVGTALGTPLEGLVDGEHVVRIQAVNAAGSAMTEASFTIDRQAPVVTLASPAPGTWNGNAPLLVYEANEGTIVVKVDGVIVNKASGLPLDPLADGVHVVRVEATDEAGNIGFAEATFTVDTTAPVVTITSPSAGLGNNRTPILGYSVSDGTAVVKVDGMVLPITSGHPLPALADGTHTLRVESTDAAGNTGGAEVSFTVDATAPTVAISSPAAGLTNDASPVLAYTVSDGSVVVKVDGVAVPMVSGDRLELSDGSHTVRVESTDAAGNAASAQVAFTVDTATSVTLNPLKTLTNSASQTISGTREFDAPVTVSLDTAAVAGTVSYPSLTSWSCSISGLVEGANTVTATVKDAAGNQAQVTGTITLDTVPPVVAIASPVGLVNTNYPLLSYSSNGSSVQVNVDYIGETATNGQPMPYRTEGAHTVRVVAYDQAGNVAVATEDFVVDTVAPMASATTALAAGNRFTFALQSDGTLWASGRNNYGQLGDGTVADKPGFGPTAPGNDWAAVAAGESHTIALKKDGTLWAWGYNWYGQLGDGTRINQSSPVQVGSDSNWAAVSAAGNRSAAVKSDGSLWSWGDNWYGQVGDGTTTHRDRPVQVGQGLNWSSVSCGPRHTLALQTDGSLWAWGSNWAGQLGDGVTIDRKSPVKIGNLTWSKASAGGSHSLAVKADGTLWAWGNNYNGQLGTGDYVTKHSPTQVLDGNRWSSVAAGSVHSVAVMSDGLLATWGSNYYWQLGDDSYGDRKYPMQVGSARDWSAAVAAGADFTVGIKSDGSLWGFGENTYEQQGVGPSHLYPGQRLAAGSLTINDGAGVTNSTAVTLGLAAGDKHGVTAMRFSNDGAEYTSAEPYATSKAWELLPGDGPKTVFAKFMDAAGNWSLPFAVRIALDTTAPAVTISSPAFGLVGTSTPALTYLASDGTVVVKVDGVIVPKVSGDTLGPLADGTHTVRVESTDAAGNTSYAEVSFTVDATAPIVAITSPAAGLTNNSSPMLAYAVSDGIVVVRVDGAVLPLNSGDQLPSLADGAHTVRVESTDAAGNVAFAEVTFSVDATAPAVAITSPAAGLSNNSTPVLVYTFGDGTAIVKVDGVVVPKLSGDQLVLADGTHTVRVESTDAAGNSGFAEVTFSVDTAAPVVTVSAPAAGLTNNPSPLLAYSVSEGNAVVKVDGVVATKASGDTLGPLADGAHTARVESTDAAGNAAFAEVSFTVDATAPTVAITSPAPGLTNYRSPVLAYAVNDGNVVVKVDGVVLPLSSGDQLPSLADGAHTVRVESTDAAGNAAFAEVSFSVDATAPTVAITSPAAGLTNNSSPALVYAVSDGNVVVKVDGAVRSLNSGDPLLALADGTHVVRVESADAAGNTAFAEISFSVDTTAPAVAITSPAAGLSNNSTPVLVYTFGDGTAIVKVDGVVVAKLSGDQLLLADGTHTVRVESTDAAGNSGFAEVTFSVDTAAPVVTVSAPAAGLTNNPSPLLAYSVSEGNAVVKVDGVVVTKASGETLGPLADGVHTVRVESTDAAGNTAYAEVSFTVDATAPTVAITSPSAGLTNNSSPVLAYAVSDGNVVVKVDGVVLPLSSGDPLPLLADGTHVVRLESTDAAGNVAFLEVALVVDATAPVVAISSPAAGLGNNGSPALIYSVSDGSVVVKVDGTVLPVNSGDSIGPLADGAHTVRVESVDAAGNAAFAEVAITVDTAAPVVSISSPAPGFTGSNTPVLSYMAGDGTVVVKVDGVVVQTTSGEMLDLLADGVHVVRVESTDAAANTGAVEVTFSVDTAAPAVAIASPAAGLTNNRTPLLNYSLSDGSAQVRVDGVVVGKTSGETLEPLTDGTHTVRVEGTDVAGNAAFAEVTFTVDATAPVVSIAAPVAGTTPDHTPLLVFGAGDGSVVVKVDGVSVSNSSGTSLAALGNGTHTVTVESTDAAGNVGVASVTFTVAYSPLSVAGGSLAWGTAGAGYSQTVGVTGGVAPYAWSVVGGALPGGLSLDASTGAITGTPSAAGTFNFTVQAADSDGAAQSRAFSIVVYLPVQVETSSLAAGYAGAAYSQSLSAAGGLSPYTWSVASGSLPSGLALDPATGVISGTPSTAETASFTVQCRDANLTAATQVLSIEVNPSRPDLVASSVSGPTTGIRSKKVFISVTVSNQGQAQAAASTATLYLSLDGSITTGDIKLADTQLGILNPGTAQTVNVNVTIPAGIAAGNYYIGAIADRPGLVAETNEANNARTGNLIEAR